MHHKLSRKIRAFHSARIMRYSWRQVWVSHGYAMDYTGRLNDNGQTVLKGEIDSYQPGTRTPFA